MSVINSMLQLSLELQLDIGLEAKTASGILLNLGQDDSNVGQVASHLS